MPSQLRMECMLRAFVNRVLIKLVAPKKGE